MSLVLPGVWTCLPEPSVAALPVDPSLKSKYQVQTLSYFGGSTLAQRSTMVHKEAGCPFPLPPDAGPYQIIQRCPRPERVPVTCLLLRSWSVRLRDRARLEE